MSKSSVEWCVRFTDRKTADAVQTLKPSLFPWCHT
uniref:Uncharacterized protein n=1 Tax=Anguilla anguilla TaxID=7936 RepID=A0A0E9V5J3_ANGAN